MTMFGNRNNDQNRIGQIHSMLHELLLEMRTTHQLLADGRAEIVEILGRHEKGARSAYNVIAVMVKQVELGQLVQSVSEERGGEIESAEIHDLFRTHFVADQHCARSSAGCGLLHRTLAHRSLPAGIRIKRTLVSTRRLKL